MWTGKNYIKREFTNTEDESFEKVNPATEKVLGVFPKTSKETVDDVIAVAKEAFKKWKTFQTELDDSNLQYNVFFTEKSKHATALTLSALKKGANRIVSFGGDGTLNEVVQGILLSQTNVIDNVDLVVIGAGSSNDYEKTFDKKSWIEKI